VTAKLKNLSLVTSSPRRRRRRRRRPGHQCRSGRCDWHLYAKQFRPSTDAIDPEWNNVIPGGQCSPARRLPTQVGIASVFTFLGAASCLCAAFQSLRFRMATSDQCAHRGTIGSCSGWIVGKPETRVVGDKIAFARAPWKGAGRQRVKVPPGN
jgi:hypothetical protein